VPLENMGGGDGEARGARAPQLLGCGGTQYKMPTHFLVIIILFFIAVLKWTILIKDIV